MRATNGTTQHNAVERIGELFLVARAQGTLVEFAAAVASDFDVDITFDHKKGDFPTYDAAEIKAIKASANVHFEGEHFSATATRGADLLPLFSRYQISALEDKLLARVNALEFDK